ncbi:MAG: polyprenyl synthetase family protein [Eubacteriales bacterium]
MEKDRIAQKLEQVAEAVTQCLDRYLTSDDPDTRLIFDAMRYSALAGGKRIRPFLCLSVCEMFGGDEEQALLFGTALEMVHTYSLIHDDLPLMDNDDFRRGKPTNHKVYGEAVALLAGDGLLTAAFALLSHAPLPPERALAAIAVLTDAADARAMIGGQVMDMTGQITLPGLLKMHEKKTGAMMCAAVRLGLLAAGVTDAAATEHMVTYARHIGLAFQIVDDLLDVYGEAALMGKDTAQDKKAGKRTIVAYYDRPEDAFAYARQLTEQAQACLLPYPNHGVLYDLAHRLLHRNK